MEITTLLTFVLIAFVTDIKAVLLALGYLACLIFGGWLGWKLPDVIAAIFRSPKKSKVQTITEQRQMTPYESDAEVFRLVETDDNFKSFVFTFKNILDDIKKNQTPLYVKNTTDEPDEEVIEECVNKILDNINSVFKDAEMALKKMGYKQTQIKTALEVIRNTSDEILTTSDVVTRALTILNN